MFRPPTPPASRPRLAFTLIELLVVIAIIAVLIGLLLPAVQKVREAAARMKCSNNVKQLIIGMHNYEGVEGHYPPAIRNSARNYPGPYYDVFPGWGWGTLILPYVEQGNLYRQLNPDQVPFGPQVSYGTITATPLTQTALSVFRCPSDPAPDRNPFRLEDVDRQLGMSNYRAVCGTDPGGAGTGAFYPNEDRNGIMWQNSKVKFVDVTDGTSNTVVIGECFFEQDKTKRKWAAILGRAHRVLLQPGPGRRVRGADQRQHVAPGRHDGPVERDGPAGVRQPAPGRGVLRVRRRVGAVLPSERRPGHHQVAGLPQRRAGDQLRLLTLTGWPTCDGCYWRWRRWGAVAIGCGPSDPATTQRAGPSVTPTQPTPPKGTKPMAE